MNFSLRVATTDPYIFNNNDTHMKLTITKEVLILKLIFYFVSVFSLSDAISDERP